MLKPDCVNPVFFEGTRPCFNLPLRCNNINHSNMCPVVHKIFRMGDVRATVPGIEHTEMISELHLADKSRRGHISEDGTVTSISACADGDQQTFGVDVKVT